MGLDHWAYVYNEDGTRRYIAKWRKNYYVHNIMTHHWKRASIDGEERSGDAFNCVEIEITPEILADVYDDCREAQSVECLDLETAMFLGAANELIRAGTKVYYNSWW